MADLGELIRRTDWYRGSSPRLDGRRLHKEWQHVNVIGDGIEAYVNFNLMDDQRPAARPGATDARTIVIVREPGRGWTGGVHIHDESVVDAKRARFDMRLGDDVFELRDGVVIVKAWLPRERVGIDLRLEPRTTPMLGPNTPLQDGLLHWLVVPRLEATGTIRVEDREFALTRAPAYHDHNWGEFLWGHDLSWEWGFGVPPDPNNPWSCVFVRFSDRMRTKASAQGLFFWNGEEQHRTFRENELTIELDGHLRPKSVTKIPPVMALLAPDRPTDVPERLRIVGEGRGDRVEAVFECRDVCQIVIPTQTDLSVTTINEVSGHLHVSGTIRGEPLEIDGGAVFEFLSF
jgi:hypothetical protein